MITNNSAEASGPSLERATPGASAMIRVESRRKPLTISLSAPLRSTIAESGDPEEVIARRNPTRMDSTPTNTVTTPAIPTTDAATEPRRWGTLNSPNAVTEPTWENQLAGPAIGMRVMMKHESRARNG